ncbi:hypothetical protein Taro_032421 [Colocasia esculenta]|uniref:CCHC-type domain-containing protein n=1 Tax=Colocasia esculenta TaxID=4460 RepID=A0A843VUU7_COLES|nr:hypothetical protein [Colocasia esculenta]
MLSKRLQRILAKKKKFQSGRRHFKRNKEFKKPKGKDQKKGEPICYECKRLGHIKAECPRLKKPEFKKKESSKKFRKYKKKAMAAAWSNSSDSDSESSSTSDEEEANLAFMANTEEKNLSLLDFMASTTVSGTVGGYGAAFLTAEQQSRFASVKAKVCGNKAVDLANLEKNGMGSLVEALQRLKWTKIATLSEVSYPDLVKAFYVCLKTEADGTLTSLVKGTQIRISRDLLASLFDVSTTGHSGVHSEDTNIKGLGIIGPEYKLKDGKLDINQLSAFNRLLHFIICQIIVPRSASFSTCARADSDLISQLWDTKSKLNILLPYAHLLTRIFQHFGINTVEDPPPSSQVGSLLREVLDSISQGEPVASNPHERVMEEALGQQEQGSAQVDSVDAPIQGEQAIEPEVSASQGAHTTDAPANERSNLVHDEDHEPGEKRSKRIALRRLRKTKKNNLKPILEKLEAQEEILSSIQSNASLSEILKAVGSKTPPQPSAPQSSLGAIPRPSGPSVQVSGPSGPEVATESSDLVPSQGRQLAEGAVPSGQNVEEPTGSVISMEVLHGAEEATVAPEAPESSTLATPTPSTPPSSSTAPPAPPTFKQPMPRTISSPTPFPSQPSFSPSSSQIIPPPPVIENPPASSSTGASSSSSHSTTRLSSTFNSKSLLYPSTPPSSITFIPENPQLGSATNSPSPVQKKRKLSTSISVPSTPKFPPLWFSLTAEIDRRPIYREYLQKCILSTIFGIPFLNLTDHLTIVLPYCHLSKANQSKILQLVECKSEDQIARHFQLYNDYCYLHKIPEVQFDQFHGALALLRTEHLRFARIMGRLSAKQDWEKRYRQSALQLESVNSSLFKAGKPSLSAKAFLDLNSINPSTFFRFTMDKHQYALFLEDQWQLYIQLMLPSMGDSFTIAPGGLVFLLVLVLCLFPSDVKEDLVESKEDLVGIQGVVFPSIVKEDLVGIQGVVVPFM